MVILLHIRDIENLSEYLLCAAWHYFRLQKAFDWIKLCKIQRIIK